MECAQYIPRCREHLKDHPKFQEVQKYFSDTLDEMDVFVPMVRGHFIGRSKSGNQTLHLLKKDDLTPLDNEEFEKNLTDFMEKTEGRYNPEALRIIRELAQENPEDFRKVAGFNGQDLNNKVVDAAIKNSKQGIPTILDIIPADRKPIEAFTDRLKEIGHEYPVHVALVHVPFNELTKRMEQINKDAMSEGDNPNNRRDGLFPHNQYGQIFGS